MDRMLQTDFLGPDAMPIRPEQTLFLLINGPLTTSTTSTKPGSESEYLIDTDSELGYSTPSPYAILNTSLSTANAHATRSETPVSDPGPEPRPGSSVLNI